MLAGWWCDAVASELVSSPTSTITAAAPNTVGGGWRNLPIHPSRQFKLQTNMCESAPTILYELQGMWLQSAEKVSKLFSETRQASVQPSTHPPTISLPSSYIHRERGDSVVYYCCRFRGEKMPKLTHPLFIGKQSRPAMIYADKWLASGIALGWRTPCLYA